MSPVSPRLPPACLGLVAALWGLGCTAPAGDTTDDDDATDDDGSVDVDVDLDKVQAFLLERLAGDDEIVGVEATTAALGLIGAPVPEPDRVAAIYDSQQRPDGTWRGINDDDLHYAVFTMIYAMAYRRIDRAPAQSLDAWAQRVDTWAEVEDEMRTYENPYNFWGGAVGYVMLWISLTGEAPPWIAPLEALAVENEADWVTNNHQRARAVQTLLAAGAEVPMQAELLASILAQQNDGGGWGSEEDAAASTIDDTAQTITVLDRLFSDDLDARRAAAEAAGYVATLYREDELHAGFAFREGDELDVDATFFGLVALVQLGVVPGDLSFHHPIGDGWSGL